MPIIAGPFGLVGFGLSTFLLSLSHLYVFPPNTMNLAMAYCLGCLMQFFGAIQAYIRGEFFGAYVFGGYAAFWLSFAMTLLLPTGALPLPDKAALAWYLCVWGIFTGVNVLACWYPKSNWALRVLLILVFILFYLLAASEWILSTTPPGDAATAKNVEKAAGAVGVAAGVLAFYMAMAEIINEHYGWTVLPLFPCGTKTSNPPPKMIPGPFGLLGFGMATVLLNIVNCGAFALSTMNIAMGFSLGCIFQFLGALIAYQQDELVPAYAFAAYAMFWMSFGITFCLGDNVFPYPNNLAMGWYLAAWGAYTFFMLIVVWKPKTSWALRGIFFTLVFLFYLLAIGNWVDPSYSKPWVRAAGAFGIVCGGLAFYTALAEFLNNCWGFTVLPIGIVSPAAVAPKVGPAAH